ncbi:MAG: lactonase family protein [Pirellulales bacterium]|nr:lactonase family protein [Pirellulales bacterium]
MNHCMIMVVTALIAVTLTDSPTAAEQPAKLWVYFGTYTRGDSKGIYRGTFDLESGRLENVEVAGQTANPSYVALHPSKPLLYAVGELGNFAGKKGGAVSAFSMEPGTGKLTLLNQQSSGGSGPCYVTVDPTGRNVLAANYGSGSVACLPIQGDGRLGEATSTIQHEGSSVNPKRQQGPHAHSINLDASGRFAVAADLGLDKLLIYRLDAEHGTLTPNDPPFAAVAPGAGPRHFDFHPNGRYAYVVNEINCTVTAFRYDAQRGTLEEVQTLPTLPREVLSSDSTAHIQVHPSGKFVYSSNRGHNSITVFTVDGSTGKLHVAGHASTRGKIPRNFGTDPTGKYLLAANQDTDNVVVFRIAPDSGRLEPTGQEVRVPAPVCVKFVRPVQ